MNTALPAPLVEGFDLYTSNNRHRAIQSLRKIAAALMMSVGLHAVSLIGAEPDTVYLAKAEAFIIEEDVGDPGLSAGDRVTWQSETQGAAAGLVFGEDALLTAGAALHAVPSGGTIRIARGHYPISETLLIEQDVTRIGDGAQATYISGNREHRIVDVPGGHLVNFRHLTLTGGLSPADDPGGDAVRIGANAHVTFGFCEITDSGGESVVFAAGKLRFLNGAIRNNHGTAIRADATTAGRVWFDNSTMAGNQATGTAAGIQFTGGQVWARNSSIVLNTSTAGSPAGGIVKIGSGQLHLRNTVVAGNTVDGVLADISGAVYNSSYIRYSLIGDAATSGGIPHGAHGTIVGIDGEGTIPYEDLLHPPALLYGGSTVTVAPVPGSPLVGAGSNSLLPPDAVDIDGDGNTSEAIPFDQRGAGYPRLLGATVSIGAVEGAFTAPAIHEEKGPMLGDVRGVADGVLFLYLPPPGNLGEIKVIASEAGYLDAWIDAGADGVFDPEDKIGGGPSIPLVAGEQIIPVGSTWRDKILSAPRKTYARFRISTEGGLDPTEAAPDGESEDYEVILPASPKDVYVAEAEDFWIEDDVGETGLSPGDRVTWQSETQGTVSGLVFGENAFVAPNAAFNAVVSGGTIRIARGHYFLTETLLIKKNLTLIGDGAQATYLDGNHEHRIADIPGSHSVNFHHLTLRGGSHAVEDPGGSAVRAGLNAHVIFSFCEITDCEGESVILTRNKLRFLNGTIRDNRAVAIHADQTPEGRVWFDNSTIHSNEASGTAAGIRFLSGQVWVRNSSIVLNRSTDGAPAAGIVRLDTNIAYGLLHLWNSVVAGNTVDGVPGDLASGDLAGRVSSPRYSLIGDAGSSGTIVHGELGNIVGIRGSGTFPYEELLHPPSLSYGGSTMTVAPVAGSPLFAAGSTAFMAPDAVDLDGDGDTSEPLPFDQRGAGYPRVSDGLISIGAVNDVPEWNYDPAPHGDAGPILGDVRGVADGVVFLDIPQPGKLGEIKVIASEAGFLDAWIDVGADGVFDAEDRIGGETSLPLEAGEQIIPIGSSWFDKVFAHDRKTSARFRISSTGGLDPYESASDGEAEDYSVIIPASPLVMYVAKPEDFEIEEDVGDPGLSTGDRVTWQRETREEETGLVFGADAFVSVNAALAVVPEGGSIRIAEGDYALDETLVIDRDVTFVGDGAQATYLNGQYDRRIVDVPHNYQVHFRDLTLTGGSDSAEDPGGSAVRIAPDAFVTILHCEITDSVGKSVIYTEGKLRIMNSTIRDNDATAIHAGASPKAKTLFENSSMFRNHGNGMAGGIHYAHQVEVRTSTIALNTAASGNKAGGLVETGDGSIMALNSIIAGNTVNGAPADMWTSAGPPLGSGYTPDMIHLDGTLVADADSVIDYWFSTGSNGNIIGIKDSGTMPLSHILSPPAFNGGPTMTMAPAVSSPVIGAGRFIQDTVHAIRTTRPLDYFDLDGDGDTSEPVPYDQRGEGYPRITGYFSMGAVNTPEPHYGEASHEPAGPMLGDRRYTEGRHLPPYSGGAHSDMDGVVFLYIPALGEFGALKITVSEPGFLDAWIDVGADGFYDPEDKIGGGPSIPLVAGEQIILIDFTGFDETLLLDRKTYARFRVSSGGGLGPDGDASDGEVEEYSLVIPAVSETAMPNLEDPYVADAKVYKIEVDTGVPGLSFGDRVRWRSETMGTVSGLIFGVNAFTELTDALESVPPSGTVRLTAGRYVLDETLTFERDVTLIGDGAQATYLDGNRERRIVDIPFNNLVQFRHLTLTGGSTSGDDPEGAAVRVGADAHVTFAYCEITDSEGESVMYSEGRVRFLNGTIRDNHGVAIHADGTAAGRFWFDNSTILWNEAVDRAAAIEYAAGEVWVRNSSIVLNTSTGTAHAGGIAPVGTAGRLYLRNSVVASNTVNGTPGDISGAVYSPYYNLIGDAGSSGNIQHGVSGNIVGIAGSGTIPYADLLRPPSLAYGGSTITVSPVLDSPLLGAGSDLFIPPDALDLDGDADTSEPVPFDQRGDNFARVSGAKVSIGSVDSYVFEVYLTKVVYVAQAEDLVIERDTGDPGLSPGDLVTWQSETQGEVSGLVFGADAVLSLESALEFLPAGGTVRIAPGKYVLSQTLALEQDVIFIGDGAQATSIDGNRKYRLGDIPGGRNVHFRNLTLTGGSSDSGGDALRIAAGANLTVAFCEITNSGGSNVINSEGTVRIANSTIRNNYDTAIYISRGDFWLDNSTIYSNHSSRAAAGIEVNGGRIWVRSCSVVLNTASGLAATAGIRRYYDGTLYLSNSVVAGNTHSGSPSDLSGAVTGRNCLIGDGRVNFHSLRHGVDGNIVGRNGSGPIPYSELLKQPSLSNGGQTRTVAPVPGSPLLGAGSVSWLPTDEFDLDGDGDTSEPVPFDQRGEGYPRVSWTGVTIGAVNSPAIDYKSVSHEATGPMLGNLRYTGGGAVRPYDGPAHENVDGVVFLSIPRFGNVGALKIFASEPGFLDAWIDVAGDGSFDPEDKLGGGPSIPVVAGEQIIPIDFSAFAGKISGNLKTYARFRISSAGGLGPTGHAPDGEVEEYGIVIPAAPQEMYVALEEGWEITEDIGDPGLSLGDRVTWRTGTEEVAGLIFGEEAFRSPVEALKRVSDGGRIRIAAGRYLTGETMVIDRNVTLLGAGAQATYLDGNREHRIVDVPGSSEVHFRNLTLTGGLSPEDDPGGDALRVSADAHVWLGYCEITDSGGESAISAAGRIRILNSTIRDNQGTGIRADATTAGRVWFDNSTMVGNHATGAAGGIQFTDGQVWVRNSSLVLNTAQGSAAAGIIRTGSGQLHLRNSVVAGNTVEGTPADIAGNIYNSNYIRHSLVGDAASSGGIPHGDNGNIVGIDGVGTIPYADLLGVPSLSYGGPTMTVAPMPGSPLLAAGNTTQLPPDAVDLDGDGDTSEPIPYDQRGPGFPRVSGGTVSIGAVNAPVVKLGVAAIVELTGPEAVKGAAGDFVLSVSDIFGNPVSLGTTAVFEIATTSGGEARLNGTETLPATVEIEAGQSSVNFSYSDTEAGTQTVTATWTSGEKSLQGATAAHVIEVLAPPILDGMEDESAVYTVGDSSIAVTGTLTVFTSKPTLTGAVVWVGANFTVGEDELSFAATDGISGEYDQETGVLMLSGVASPASYEAAIRSVTYVNSSADPNPGTRGIYIQVDDGGLDNSLSNMAIREIEINRHPVAGNDVIEHYSGMPTKVRIATLLANDTDPDNDPLSLAAVAAASANGGEAVRIGEWVFYTPADSFSGSDSFTYTIEDGRGGVAEGMVAVVVIDSDDAPPLNQVRLEATADGQIHLVFAGIPGRTYTIEYMDPIGGGDREWQVLGTVTADEFGRYEWLDNPPEDVTARLYRAAYP